MRQLKSSGLVLATGAAAAFLGITGHTAGVPDSPRLLITLDISALDATPRGVHIRVSVFHISVMSFLVPQILGSAYLHAFLHSYGYLYFYIMMKCSRRFSQSFTAQASLPGALLGAGAGSPAPPPRAGHRLRLQYTGEIEKE